MELKLNSAEYPRFLNHYNPRLKIQNAIEDENLNFKIQKRNQRNSLEVGQIS